MVLHVMQCDEGGDSSVRSCRAAARIDQLNWLLNRLVHRSARTKENMIDSWRFCATPSWRGLRTRPKSGGCFGVVRVEGKLLVALLNLGLYLSEGPA